MVVRYVTFGTEHQRSYGIEWVRTEGYVTFEAPTEELVFKLINMVLGQKYAFNYHERPDSTEEGKRWYPEGQTAHIIMHFSTAHPSGWSKDPLNDRG